MADIVTIDPKQKSVIPQAVLAAMGQAPSVASPAVDAIPVSTTDTPQGPPVPPELLAAMDKAPPSLAGPKDTPVGPPAPDADPKNKIPDLITEHVLPQEKLPSAVDNSTNMQSLAAMPPAKPQVADAPSLMSKIKPHIPQILNALGIVGGGLEGAFGPIGAEPQGAKMFMQAKEAAANRAIASRKTDIEQQQADTNEGYRTALQKQYDTVPVQVQDPTDPTKTITIQVQQKDAGKYAGSVVGANAKTGVANINRASALDVAQLRASIALGKVTRVVDAKNEKGQLGKAAYNAQGQLVGFLPGALPSAAYLPKSSATDDFMPDAEGNIVRVRKNSSSAPVIPGVAGGGGGGSQVPQPNVPQRSINPMPGNRAQPVLDATGNQLHKPISSEGKKTLSQIYTTENMVGDVMPDLQSLVKDMGHGGNLADTTEMRAAWHIYKDMGIDPANVDKNSLVSALPNIDPRMAALFPTIAMLQVVGAQPYLKGVRNFNYVKQVQQHIPNPELDTPQLMLTKLQNLSHQLPQIEQAIYQSEGIGMNGRQASGAGNSILPPAAAAQLQEGHETTFANGQVWTKQNGKPVQVK